MPDAGRVSGTGHARCPGVGDRARYEIRVRDHLASCWSGWFEGLTVTNVGLNEALIEGMLPDQAALHGVLARVGDLNLQLISVRRLEAKGDGTELARKGDS